MTGLLSDIGVTKNLQEIVEERSAGLPPEQKGAVLERTILEILRERPAVLLTGAVRRYVLRELERRWIPPGELRKIERQRRLEDLETSIFLAKWYRKTGELKLAPLKFIAKSWRFQSVAALKQWIKRERQAKTKPRR